jgi:membrane protein YqaA with SNARE-associated domain
LKDFFLDIAAGLLQMGGFGLLILGLLDSSILFAPLGNDLLMIVMTARHPQRLLYYAAMATAGSVLGTLIVDALARKGGEKGLEDRVEPGKLDKVQRKVEGHAGWVLALAAMVPPPFPFKVFVAAAAALQYPRKKLLAVTAAARMARFTVWGLLAVRFGTGILDLAKSPAVQNSIMALVVLSIAGSAFSVYRLLKRSR